MPDGGAIDKRTKAASMQILERDRAIADTVVNEKERRSRQHSTLLERPSMAGP